MCSILTNRETNGLFERWSAFICDRQIMGSPKPIKMDELSGDCYNLLVASEQSCASYIFTAGASKEGFGGLLAYGKCY